MFVLTDDSAQEVSCVQAHVVEVRLVPRKCRETCLAVSAIFQYARCSNAFLCVAKGVHLAFRPLFLSSNGKWSILIMASLASLASA